MPYYVLLVLQILHILFFLIYSPSVALAKTDQLSTAERVSIRPNDLSSLQRGAKYYMNYCSSCHSLCFMRYNRLGKDMGIVNTNDQVGLTLLKKNLIFTNAHPNHVLAVAMREQDAKKWFLVAPPDLSLVMRVYHIAWVYTFLMNFYQDKTRPFGVNNTLVYDTAMPDALAPLRGIKIIVYQTKENKRIKKFATILPGSLSETEFQQVVIDIVNFLAYVSEPTKQERQRLGLWTLGFCILFAILVFLLKKHYWNQLK